MESLNAALAVVIKTYDARVYGMIKTVYGIVLR